MAMFGLQQMSRFALIRGKHSEVAPRVLGPPVFLDWKERPKVNYPRISSWVCKSRTDVEKTTRQEGTTDSIPGNNIHRCYVIGDLTRRMFR